MHPPDQKLGTICPQLIFSDVCPTMIHTQTFHSNSTGLFSISQPRFTFSHLFTSALPIDLVEELINICLCEGTRVYCGTALRSHTSRAHTLTQTRISLCSPTAPTTSSSSAPPLSRRTRLLLVLLPSLPGYSFTALLSGSQLPGPLVPLFRSSTNPGSVHPACLLCSYYRLLREEREVHIAVTGNV